MFKSTPHCVVVEILHCVVVTTPLAHWRRGSEAQEGGEGQEQGIGSVPPT